MNLHSIASRSISAINPMVPITIQTSNGYTTNPDGSRVPAYNAYVSVLAQLQPLAYGDLVKIEGLNITAERQKVYVSGDYHAIVRVTQKGGDLVTLQDGSIWLVVQVLEDWPNWCSFAIVRQNGS
jgi:hypothetical protein